jgi:hypothetical protein
MKVRTLALNIICALVVIAFLGSCATIYKSPDFEAVKEKHETLAILPFEVSIDMKKLPEGLTTEMLNEMEQDEAYVIQSEIYAYFLKGVSRGKYTIDFQDIDTTNSLCSQMGIIYDNMRDYTKVELAEKLNVNVVLSGTVHRSKPMSEAAAFFTFILIGWGGATNNVDVGVNIHDGVDGKLLWKYNHTYSGGIGSSPQSLTKGLMKHVSRKFPYTTKKKDK